MDHLETVINSSSIGLCLLDKEFTIISSNHQFANIHNTSPDEIKGGSIFKYAPLMKKKLTDLDGLKSLFQGIPMNIKPFYSKNIIGSTPEYYIAPIIEGQEITKFTCQATLIDNSLSQDFQNIAWENMLPLIIDHIPYRIFWKDTAYRFAGCNKAFLQDAGLTDFEQIKGKTDYDCIWKEHADLFRKDDKEVVEKGISKINYEEVQSCTNGQLKWLKVSKIPIRDDAGEIVGVFGSYEEITEKKIAEQALQQSEKRYRELVDFLPETIFEIDVEGYITYLSPNGFKSLGYDESDLDKKIHLTEIVVENNKDRSVFDFDTFIRLQQAKKVTEHLGMRKNGTSFPIAVASVPIEDQNVLTGFRGIIYDLSVSKQAQLELLKEKNMHKAILDAMPDVSFVLDEHGTYLEFLSVNEDLMIRPSVELKNKKLQDFFNPETTNQFIEAIQTTIQTRQSQNIEYNFKTIKGNILWFHGRTSCYFDELQKKHLVIWTAREITELKNIQNQLEESKENLSITLESIGDGVIATDREGAIVSMNAVAEYLTGWNRTDAIGKKIDEVFNLFSATHNSPVKNPIYRSIQEGRIIVLGNNTSLLSKDGSSHQITNNSAPIRKKDGSILGAIIVFQDVTDKYRKQRALQKSEDRLKRAQEVAHVGDWEFVISGDKICGSEEAFRIYGYKRIIPCISIRKCLAPVHPEDLEKVTRAFERLIEDANHFDIEYRIFKAHSRQLRYVRAIAKPFVESDGKVVILGTIQDVTETKMSEEELKIRNSELNNFVYRVSHDLRAPLSSIKGLIALQKMHNNTDDINYPDMMEKSINKLDQFIRDILSHSRNLNTAPQIQEIDFHAVIQHCFEELTFMTNFESIEKYVTIKGQKFYGDQVRMNEIFRNLISNSIKYSNTSIENKFLNILIEVSDEEALIQVEDNGIGIPYNIQSKVFDMFYRGNEKSDGSGIGLYIVKQAVQKLNGLILLESEPEKGSKFTLKLPNQENILI